MRLPVLIHPNLGPVILPSKFGGMCLFKYFMSLSFAYFGLFWGGVLLLDFGLRTHDPATEQKT